MSFIVIFTLGVLVSQLLAAPLHGLSFAVAAGLWLLCLWRGGYLARLAAVGLCGLMWGGGQIAQLCTSQLQEALDNSEWQADFLLTQVQDRPGPGAQLQGQLLHLDCSADCPSLEGKRFNLSWYQAPATAAGEIWRLQVRLKRLHGFANPGGFDFQAYQLAQGLIGTASVKSGQRLAVQAPNWTARWRQRLLLIMSGGPDTHPARFARFYRALAFGDTSGMDWQDWQILQRTGTVHLMAISGFQVGLIAWLGFGVGLGLARLSNLLMPGAGVWALRLWPWCLSIGGAWLYTALANYAVPAQRALVAVGLLNSALALGWRPSALQVLGWAAFWAALREPLVALNTGFWLSYLAVLALLFAFGWRKGTHRWWREALSAQWVMTFALLIPLFCLRLPFSLSSPIANLFIAPIISVVITPSLFVALVASGFGLGEPVLWLLDWVFSACWSSLCWLAEWPPSLWWPSKPMGWVEICLGLLGTGLLLAPRGLGLRALALLLLASSLLLPANTKPALAVTVLDVGQGLAVAIQTPQDNLLYDLGPVYSPQFDAGTGIVLPFLIGSGVRQADVMVSHDDANHNGGWRGLATALPLVPIGVGEHLSNLPLAPRCWRGQHWTLDQVQLQVLWPPLMSMEYGNNRSCVLLLRFGAASLLLTADIDKTVEQRLLELGDLPHDLSLLVAPNHGSPSASSPAFLTQTAPQVAVFSTGRYNPYHQPNAKVVATYAALAIPTFNTATSGAVTLRWAALGQAPSIQVERRDNPKPWYSHFKN